MNKFASSFFFVYAQAMDEKPFSLPSFAKINLFLHIAGKRSDGFHEICTIFQTVSLCDYLTFSHNDELVLTCDNKKIPVDSNNLIIKAAQILRENYAVKKGARIHLEKHIPSPGGLGGGSSNAATALIGLIRLWKIAVDFNDLCEIGKRIGSDVPFFFYGGTAIGTGRGTKISLLDDYHEQFLLIVTPKIDVSTRDAFAHLNAPDLTNKTSKSILQICRDTAKALYLRQSALRNDFERVIFEIEPEIAKIKEELISCGAKRALLSGSGASIFGIFETSEVQQKALKFLRANGWQISLAKTISRFEYQKSLRLDKEFV